MINRALLLLLNLFFAFTLLAQSEIPVAVMELTGEGISSSEARIITSRLRTDLFKTNKFIIAEREKMEEILSEQGFQLSGCTSNECVIEVGKLLGVKVIVAGEIGKIGRLFTLSIRMIDVQSGKVIKTATEDCECRIEEVLTISVKNVANILAGLEPTIEAENIKKYSTNFYQPKRNPFPKKKSPETAFALSFFVPGVGQYYNDNVIKGLIQQVIWLGGIVSLIATPAPGSYEEYYVAFGITAGICSWVWSIIDAPLSSIKINKQLEKTLSSSFHFNQRGKEYSLGLGFKDNSLVLAASINF